MIVRNTDSITDLETLYESTTLKESIRNHYKRFDLKSIDALLESDQELGELELEVIEELFGRTRAKLAGAGAKLGAQASNIKNRVATGASNLGQKAKAVAGNVVNDVRDTGRRHRDNIRGYSDPNETPLTRTDVRSVGNQQAQIQDPNQAATAAKLQTILPELQKSISSTFSKIDGDFQALGLDANALGQINPAISKYINYAKGALKKAYTELSKASQ